MKALKLNFLFKLLILVILPLFLFFSSLSIKPAFAACDTTTCPSTHVNYQCSGNVCEEYTRQCRPSVGPSGTCTIGPHGSVAQNLCCSSGTCVNGACSTGSTCADQGGGCKAADVCTSEGGSSVGTLNCTLGNICCVPPGGGGGGPPPSNGEIPPKGVYLSCYKHDEKCWINVAKNGIQCCNKSDTCVPIPWVSFNGEWPGVCKNPIVVVEDTSCNGSWCNTALGQISTGVGGFSQDLFRIVLGISGGIAVILIIISGYKLMTSRGNPEQLQQAKEQLTAAIVGLLFIIFSLVILQSIGVNILQLPGFRG